MTIGALIRDARKSRDLSQREVATKAELSIPYLSDIERGNRNAPAETLARIAKALGLDPAALLTKAANEKIKRVREEYSI